MIDAYIVTYFSPAQDNSVTLVDWTIFKCQNCLQLSFRARTEFLKSVSGILRIKAINLIQKIEFGLEGTGRRRGSSGH